MGRFKWQPWAHNQGIGSSLMVLLGGIISMFYPNQIIAAVNILVPFLLMLLELFPLPQYLGPVSTNYYVRALMYALAVVPSMFQAPTMTGGLCMFTCSITYLKAALGGENGVPETKSKRSK